jgi:hypothetical protein
MSLALAAFIYRWRFLLSGLIVAGAVLLSPRANIIHIDNDITPSIATTSAFGRSSPAPAA